MQLLIRNPAAASEGSPPEWAIIELQGDLESRSQDSFSGKHIGNLMFTKEGTPVMIIGHHILYGKVVDLEKPFVVIRKGVQRVHSDEMDTEDRDAVIAHQSAPTTYDVQALIKKKVVFKTRPKPIIANVPKKL